MDAKEVPEAGAAGSGAAAGVKKDPKQSLFDLVGDLATVSADDRTQIRELSRRACRQRMTETVEKLGTREITTPVGFSRLFMLLHREYEYAKEEENQAKAAMAVEIHDLTRKHQELFQELGREQERGNSLESELNEIGPAYQTLQQEMRSLRHLVEQYEQEAPQRSEPVSAHHPHRGNEEEEEKKEEPSLLDWTPSQTLPDIQTPLIPFTGAQGSQPAMSNTPYLATRTTASHPTSAAPSANAGLQPVSHGTPSHTHPATDPNQPKKLYPSFAAMSSVGPPGKSKKRTTAVENPIRSWHDPRAYESSSDSEEEEPPYQPRTGAAGAAAPRVPCRVRQLDILAKDVDRFEPEKRERNVNDYFCELERALLELPGATSLEKARLIWKTSSTTVRGFLRGFPPHELDNYKKLRKHMIDEYSTYTDETAATMEALQVKHQKHEHPRTYFTRLREAYFQGSHAPGLEEDRIFKSFFLNNLHPSIKDQTNIICRQKFHTMKEIRAVATMTWQTLVKPKQKVDEEPRVYALHGQGDQQLRLEGGETPETGPNWHHPSPNYQSSNQHQASWKGKQAGAKGGPGQNVKGQGYRKNGNQAPGHAPGGQQGDRSEFHPKGPRGGPDSRQANANPAKQDSQLAEMRASMAKMEKMMKDLQHQMKAKKGKDSSA